MASSEPQIRTVGQAHDDPRMSLGIRVAGSESFRRSTRLRALLLHLCDRAFHGYPDDLTEQQIGTAVFGKPANYDSANENVVRVAARQLRLKLQEFFETEGRNEPNVIVIPKGSYVPEVQPRVQPAEPPPISLPPVVQHPEAFNYWMWVAAVCFLIAVFASFSAYSNWRQVRDSKLTQQLPEPSQNLVKSTVLVPGQRTLLVIGDPNLGRLAERTGTAIGLDRYLTRNLAAALASVAPQEKAWWENLLSSSQTDTDSLMALVRVLQANPESARMITVQHASEVRTPEFRASNILLIGTPAANPWIDLVNSEFNFQVFLDGVKSVAAIRNREPRSGEQAQYSSQTASNRAVEFAHIAMRPNLNRNGSILLVSGTNSEAVGSAAEFACARESVARLCSIAKLENLQEVSSFELVLRVDTAEGVAQDMQVIAWRTTLRSRM
jgi:hypothetical protein